MKSVCQIRGVPHPQACAFVADSPNLIAIAGWDADGNGVLLVSEFSVDEEPRRVGYHVLCKSAIEDQSLESRRRRRMRGWTPKVPETPEGGRLYVGDRLEVLEQGMEQIQFEEQDEFVSILPVLVNGDDEPDIYDEPSPIDNVNGGDGVVDQETKNDTAPGDDVPENTANNEDDDSVQTEPLDDLNFGTQDEDGDY